MGSESKHISLGAISGSNAVAKSIAGATNTNARGNSSASAQNVRGRWNKHEGLRKLSEQAKANGMLIKNIILRNVYFYYSNISESILPRVQKIL